MDERREKKKIIAKLIDPNLHDVGLSEDLIQRELRIAEEKITDEFRNRKRALRPDYIL